MPLRELKRIRNTSMAKQFREIYGGTESGRHSGKHPNKSNTPKEMHTVDMEKVENEFIKFLYEKYSLPIQAHRKRMEQFV